jgi:hypothetical protein
MAMGGAKGVDRPAVEDTKIGKQYLELLGKADKRTQQMYDLIEPLLGTAKGQASDILAGLSGPYTPAIQAAMGSSRQALSQSNALNSEDWNRMGITGTDYASLMANQTRQGEQKIAEIPGSYTTPVLNAIFAALTGTQATATTSQGNALNSAAGVTSSAISPITGKTALQDFTEAFRNIGEGVGAVYKGS